MPHNASRSAIDEASALRQGLGDIALEAAQARLHAAMAARRQPAIDHAISVCRLLIIGDQRNDLASQ